jgi:PAS domain S-box-containing protein
VVYAVLGGLWVLFSDRLLLALVRDQGARDAAQTAKGWLFVSVSAVLVYGFVRLAERAERRASQAEDSLRANREWLRSIAEHATDMIFRYRVAEPPGYEYVSPSATEITGFTPEEHYADPDLAFRIVHPDDRGALERLLRGESRGERVRSRRKDGDTIWTEFRVRTTSDEDERPLAVEGIVRDVTALALVEQDLEARAREHGRLAEERLMLMRKLVHAQEEERRRVALEIHDGIGQVLTSISLFASDLPEVVPEEHRARAERVRELIQRAIADSRMLVWSLRPPDLERLGLVPAIQHLVENLLERATEHIDVLDETGGRRLTPEIETVVFRVVQEALNNATKYAHASSISVVVAIRDGVLSAVVEDDGRGFDIETVETSGGVGLGGMRERADFVGGRLVVESAKDVGTVVRLEVPIP